MTLICSCGRTVHVQGNKAVRCKCGRTHRVRTQEPFQFRRRRRARGLVKKKAGQTLRQLQGLLVSAGFVVLVITAIALVSLAGR